MAPDSRRLVLEATAVAVVRAGAGRHDALPPTVTFGGPPSRSEQLLVEFAHELGDVEIDTAFLLLEPALGAEPTASDVAIDVAVVSEAWASGTAGEPPSSSGPSAAGIGRTRPPAPLRIDVTALVRELARQSQSGHGLVLRAVSPSPRGAVYSTGANGPAPRLDLYLRPGAARVQRATQKPTER